MPLSIPKAVIELRWFRVSTSTWLVPKEEYREMYLSEVKQRIWGKGQICCGMLLDYEQDSSTWKEGLSCIWRAKLLSLEAIRSSSPFITLRSVCAHVQAAIPSLERSPFSGASCVAIDFLINKTISTVEAAEMQEYLSRSGLNITSSLETSILYASWY